MEIHSPTTYLIINMPSLGILLACDISRKTHYCLISDFGIVITKIEGLTSDTNATIVGAAAIEAVWKACAFQPSEEERRRLEQRVLDSWTFPREKLPNFEL